MEQLVIVLSGPSGAGKNFKVKAMVKRDEKRLGMAVCATTRPPRDGEEGGKDYFFLTREEFIAKRDAGGFLEWAEVHGNLYGTPRSSIQAVHEAGKDAIFDVDVQGARSIKTMMPQAITVFIMPRSYAELEENLRARGKDSEATIRKRLANAPGEIARASEFDFVIANAKHLYAHADEQLFNIIEAHRLRPDHPNSGFVLTPCP